MQEHIDYILVDNDLHLDHYCIKLTSGEYAGIVYAYGNINITEEERNGETIARLSFVYEVQTDNENYSKDELKNNCGFQNHIGKILESIIINNEFKIGNNDPTA